MERQTKTALLRTVAVFAALAVCGLLLWVAASTDPVTKIGFTQNIEVVNGIASPAQYGNDLTVEEDGRYLLDIEWRCAPGLITGARLTDAEGNTVFFSCGECLQAESEALPLHAGEYRLSFYSLTSPETLSAFVLASDPDMPAADAERVTDADGNISTANDYPFRADGIWQVNCNYTLERSSLLPAQAAGVIAGAVFGLVLAALILTAVKQDGTRKPKYDERQQLARGKGYCNGFWTAIGYLALWTIAAIAEIAIPIETSMIAFIGILIAGFVFVATCIHTDAYFALNENRRRISLCLLFIGAGNVGLGIISVLSGRAIENGMLTYRAVNLLCGIFLVAIAAAIFMRKRHANREEDAD